MTYIKVVGFALALNPICVVQYASQFTVVNGEVLQMASNRRGKFGSRMEDMKCNTVHIRVGIVNTRVRKL